jgi:hypothetical protein
MRRGRIVAELTGDDITTERISAAAYAVDTNGGTTSDSPPIVQEAS